MKVLGAIGTMVLAAVVALPGGQALAHRGGYGYRGPVVVAPAPVVAVPVPAPRVYAAPVVAYQYYPAWNVYLDPVTGLFWSLQSGSWTLGPLPRHVSPRRLGRYVMISAEEGRPWRRAYR